VTDNERYLRLGGWIQGNGGWWHPPSCLASWPENEAIEMARRDEANGRRMTETELRQYLAMKSSNADEYIRMCKERTVTP